MTFGLSHTQHMYIKAPLASWFLMSILSIDLCFLGVLHCYRLYHTFTSQSTTALEEQVNSPLLAYFSCPL